jgi:hypothetical protein
MQVEKLEAPPASLSMVDRIVEIQVRIMELIAPYPNIQIVFENFNVLVREVTEFFDDYFEHHANKAYVSAYIQCIIIYYLQQIQIPFEHFLLTIAKGVLSKDQIDSLHIKLLVFVE